VPMMTFIPAGQHEASSANTAVIVCVADPTLPRASCAVQVTTVCPREKCAGALLLTTIPPAPHESVTVG